MMKPTSATQLYQLCCFFPLLIHVTSSPIQYNAPDAKKITAGSLNEPGSDAGLYNRGFYQGDIFRRRTSRANGISLWPHGVVIYKVDDKVGCPDSAQCEILMRAINHYHTHSCIRFQEWTGEQDYVRIFFSSSSGACWSTVGRSGGEQLLSLGRRCWYQGIVVHELGHSIGFWHEMNRPDRDDYININWQNIIPGFAPAFEKEEIIKNLNEEFDYKSIMMYDEFAFAKDDESPTINTKDNSVIGPIWRKPGLSESDVRRIRKLYSCANNDQMPGFPVDIKCAFNSHTCGFRNAGASTSPWLWNQVNETDGYVYTTANSRVDQEESNKNGTAPNIGYFVSVSFLGTNPADVTNSGLGCVRFWYVIRGDRNTYLKLRQSYLSHPTQLMLLPQDTFDLWESEGVTESWAMLQIPLYVNNPFKLIFESSPGNSTEGLIALDDFELSFSPCLEDQYTAWDNINNWNNV